MGFFQEWDAELTSAEMLADPYLPAVRLTNCANIAMTTAANCGADTSVTFNLNITGTLTDGRARRRWYVPYRPTRWAA